MPSNTHTCETCGRAFELPDAVRLRYPNWTPHTCLDCRDIADIEGRQSVPRTGRRRGASASRELNLTLAEVTERFSDGPQTGIFTDGSCQGNPGPGGWGAVHVREGMVLDQKWGHDPATTNNRMELTATIAGLEMAAPDEAVTIYTDSQLVVNTLTKWAAGWEKAGWKRKDGAVKNLDLVQRAYALLKTRPRVRIEWIRAHDGSLWNEYADSLATAYSRPGL